MFCITAKRPIQSASGRLMYDQTEIYQNDRPDLRTKWTGTSQCGKYL